MDLSWIYFSGPVNYSSFINTGTVEYAVKSGLFLSRFALTFVDVKKYSVSIMTLLKHPRVN